MRHYLFIFSFLLLGLYSCDTETLRIEKFDAHGIDVSHYQGQIDWQKIKEQDIHFAFVKVTEGGDFEDSLFCQNWEEIKKVGLKRGAYHFFRPKVDVNTQIANFIDNVKLQSGDFPPVLDVEVFDGVSKIQLINAMHKWLSAIEINYNIKPIIYSNLKFYNKNLAGHFNDYPLWIARYNTREPRLADNRTWHFWQYGNKGKIDGINGFVDFNVFSGTLEDLDALSFSPAASISALED